MPDKSPYQNWKDAVWNYLKSKWYKKIGNDFVYAGKELYTVVNLQRGQYKQSNYGFYNITYCRLDNPTPGLFNSDFFHLRHDYFDDKGYLHFGSTGYSKYPPDIQYGSDSKLKTAIKILKTIEPIFRCETKEDMITVYSPKENWLGMIEKLTKTPK